MPSRVPGKRSCTAWASTCAVECRMTARPSGLAAGTGSTCASACGAQARSIRSPVARSRTTTAPSGPLSGTPAALSASCAVVPAGTRIGATAVGEGGVDTETPGGSATGGGQARRRRPGPPEPSARSPTGRDDARGTGTSGLPPHLPSSCMTVQRSYENAEVGQQLYAILEAVKKPEVLWDKLTTGHYDWLGVRRNGRYFLDRPRLPPVRREDDGPIPDDGQH